MAPDALSQVLKLSNTVLALQRSGMTVQSTEPNAPNVDALWLDTTAGRLKRWTGTVWQIESANTAGDVGAVPTTRTVNGHALSADVTVTKSDVGLSNVANVDQTNANNITSGALSIGNITSTGNMFANGYMRLPVGTNLYH